MSQFATTPFDLEQMVFLASDGDFEVDCATLKIMLGTCAEYKSRCSLIIDCEGQYVAIAPEAIARLICDTLNALPGDDFDQYATRKD